MTLGREIKPLPHPFLVLATQNPVSSRKVPIHLPEAQVDRFMFKLRVDYPEFDDELEVMRRMSRPKVDMDIDEVLGKDELEALSAQVETIHIDPSLEKYILHLISATRTPKKYGLDIAEFVRFGASPRASINLALAARAEALLRDRDHVLPEDIRALAPDILRHRIALSYKAEARGITSDSLVEQVLEQVSIPNF